MTKDKRHQSLEDHMRTVIYQSKRRPEQPESPKDVIRRVSDRVGKKIEEIFSERPRAN